MNRLEAQLDGIFPLNDVESQAIEGSIRYMGALLDSGCQGSPAASIIIPTYNREEMLRWTLSSLVNQDPLTPEFEVLVCDDGSSDGTKRAVEGFSSSLNLRYFFQEDRGYRVAKARNLGIRAARGRICIFLDSGVIVRKKYVLAHLQIHASFPDPSAVIGYVHGFDEADSEGHKLLDLQVPLDPELTIERMKVGSGFPDMREPAYRECGNDLSGLPAPWAFFWTCNVSAPRAAIERAGLFDEDFNAWGVEDVDLGYRLHKLGLTFRIGWEAEAIHCPHHRDIEANQKSDRDNRRLFFKKHLDFPSETLQYSTDFSFNPMLSGFFESRRRRPAPRIDPGSVLSALDAAVRTGKVVLSGTACYACLDTGLNAECLEPDRGLMTRWAAKYPGIRFLNLLGLATPYQDGMFEAAIISPDWIHLNESWRSILFREQSRISKIQVFLLEGSGPPPGPAMAHLDLWAQEAGKRIEAKDVSGLRFLECTPYPGAPPASA